MSFRFLLKFAFYSNECISPLSSTLWLCNIRIIDLVDVGHMSAPCSVLLVYWNRFTHTHRFWPDSSCWLAWGISHVWLNLSTLQIRHLCALPWLISAMYEMIEGPSWPCRTPSQRLVEMVVYAVDPVSCYCDSLVPEFLLFYTIWSFFFCLFMTLLMYSYVCSVYVRVCDHIYVVVWFRDGLFLIFYGLFCSVLYWSVFFFCYVFFGVGGEWVCTLNTCSGIISILISTYIQRPGSDTHFMSQLIHIK